MQLIIINKIPFCTIQKIPFCSLQDIPLADSGPGVGGGGGGGGGGHHVEVEEEGEGEGGELTPEEHEEKARLIAQVRREGRLSGKTERLFSRAGHLRSF